MKKTLITLIALAGMAHADFVWNGGESITQELWQTESSWSITGSDSWPSAGTGPGTPNSNAWSLISVSGANGSISQLEGWTLKLALQNGADLTVGNVKKFQGGCFIDIDQSSTLTLDGGTASGLTSDGHQILTRNLVTLGSNMSFDSTNTSLEMLSGIAGIDTLTAVDDLTNAEVGSYMVTKNENGYSVSYVVPEPAAASLSLLGLAGLAMRRRRK